MGLWAIHRDSDDAWPQSHRVFLIDAWVHLIQSLRLIGADEPAGLIERLVSYE